MKILAITYAKLGDSLVLLPTLNLLKNELPDAQIDFLSEKRNSTPINAKYALESTGIIRKFFLFSVDRRRLMNKFSLFINLIVLRIVKYDLAIILLPPFNPATEKTLSFLTKLARIIKVKRIISPNKIHTWRYNQNGSLKEMEPASKVLFKMVVNQLKQLKFIKNDNYDIHHYQYYIKYNPIRQNKILVSLGGDMKVKKWPVDNYVKFLTEIKKNYEFEFVYVCTSGDISEAQKCHSKTGGKILVNESIKNIYVEAAESKYFIGNDSGIMHLANLAKTPIITIFSARDAPGIWYPLGNNNLIFRKTVECEGCMLTDCGNPICITQITCDEVFKLFQLYEDKVYA